MQREAARYAPRPALLVTAKAGGRPEAEVLLVA
jgi:hypothetical protein